MGGGGAALSRLILCRFYMIVLPKGMVGLRLIFFLVILYQYVYLLWDIGCCCAELTLFHVWGPGWCGRSEFSKSFA